jgi:deoxyadenosine/deoxycytidine kinase
MKKRDYETYMELYASMREALQPPDLLIYLRCDTRAIRRRIKSRGRASEQEIPVSYISKLNKLYEEWIAGYDQSPVLIWDSGRMDYLTSVTDRIDFQRAVERFL